MLKRIIIAAIACPIIYFIIMFENPYPLYVLITVAFTMGLNEMYNMFDNKSLGTFRYFGIAAVLAGYALIIYKNDPVYMFYALVILVITLLSTILITKNIERDMPRTINTIFPFAYVGALGSFAILLRQLPNGNYWIFSLMMFTWIYDGGAYFTGVAFGKHKLIPELSPKKTVEGFIGGILVNVAAAVILKYTIFPLFFPLFPLHHLIILAVLLAFTGQVGDIAESVVKRYTGVKNSSSLLSEMGGIMDKIDSTLFNAPILYLYIKIFIKQLT